MRHRSAILVLVLATVACPACGNPAASASAVTRAAAKVTFEARAARNWAAKAAILCGAATKKGAASTRRVKAEGERCFMHKGAK